MTDYRYPGGQGGVELEPETAPGFGIEWETQPESEEEHAPAPMARPAPLVRPKSSGSDNPLGWALAALLASAVVLAGVQSQAQPGSLSSPAGNPVGQAAPNPGPQPGPVPNVNPLAGPQPGPGPLPQAPQGAGPAQPPVNPPINPPVEPMPPNPILPESKVVVLSVPHPCSTFNLYHCESYHLSAAQTAEVNSATVDVIDFINRGWVAIDLAGLEANKYLYGSYYGFYCSSGSPDSKTRMYEMLHPGKMVKIALTAVQITEAEGVARLALGLSASPVGEENDWTQSLPLDFSYGDWGKLYRLIDQPSYPPEVQQMSLGQLMQGGLISGFTALVSRDSRISARAKVVGIIAPAHLEVWVDTINNAYPGFRSQWSQTETLRNQPMQNLPADKTPFQLLTFAPDEPMTMYATWHVRNPVTGEEAMWGLKIVAHY